MKTPDEIKKGLECRNMGYNEKCNRKCNTCAVYIPGYSIANIYSDALAYIQQLETERHQLLTRCERLERERDAAVKDIPRACGYCKWFEINLGGNMTECHNPNGCRNISGINTGWEWRGVKEE